MPQLLIKNPCSSEVSEIFSKIFHHFEILKLGLDHFVAVQGCDLIFKRLEILGFSTRLGIFDF